MGPAKKLNKTWAEGDVGYVEIVSPTWGVYHVKFDADRIEDIKTTTWNLRLSHKKPVYASTTYYSDKKQRTLLMQSLLFPDCPDGLVRDHINGDGFDNRSSNIRFVTSSHNSLNLPNRKRKHGVQYNRHGSRTNPFAARLSLGMFPTEDEAHEAWKAAYVAVFGSLPECVDA